MKDSTDYTTRLELSGTTPAIQLASMGPARPMLLEHRALFTRLYGTPDMQVHYVTTKKTFDATRVIEKVEADGWVRLASQFYCIIEEDKHKPTECVYVKENMLLSFGIQYRKKEANQKTGPYMLDELEGISGDLVQADQLTFYTLFDSNPKYDVSPILSISSALKDMIAHLLELSLRITVTSTLNVFRLRVRHLNLIIQTYTTVKALKTSIKIYWIVLIRIPKVLFFYTANLEQERHNTLEFY
jgi:hypothetical protein